MNRKVKKLTLNRETLRNLEDSALRTANGALGPVIPIGSRVICTNEISICVYCTTPLDGCPRDTGTVA
jgi:hypothetical protein